MKVVKCMECIFVVEFNSCFLRRCLQLRFWRISSEHSTTKTTISYRIVHYKRGDMIVQERPGPLKHVTVPEMIEKAHDVILRDRIRKVEEVVKTVDMSSERVHHISHIKLGMFKLSATLVLRLLNAERERARILNQNLKLFNISFVTVSET